MSNSKFSRRTVLSSAGALTTAGLFPAFAQPSEAGWPNRPIQLLIPYPPGGSADLLARPLSAALQGLLRQPVVLDYKPGGGGVLASNLLVHSKPDGHTLIMVLAAHAINHSLFSKLPYDTRKDFAPVSLVANLPFVLVASPALKARTLEELIQEARKTPGSINYASAGVGNTGHLAAEMFAAAAGVKLTHIPYKGSAGVVNALLAGEVDIAFDTVSTAMPHVQSGRLRALATTGAQRSFLAPQTPTMQEAGLAGFVLNGWYALMAPAGVPLALRQRLSRDIAAALSQPDIKKQLQSGGYELVGSTPAELEAHIDREIERWAKVIASTGAKAE